MDGQKATRGNPIQELRTRMNRDTKVNKFEESTGSKEETDSEKDRDDKEERATLAKSAITSAPELVKMRQTTLAHSLHSLPLPLVEHSPIEMHKPSPSLPPPPAMPSP